jgi:copper chaperone
MKFHVPDMSCGHCRATIERAVTTADPAARVAFDGEARTVAIETARPEPEMRAALTEAGYAPA